jgi:hypothetical protein
LLFSQSDATGRDGQETATAENSDAFLIVVHDLSSVTTTQLPRVSEAYLVPIIERVRVLASVPDVQVARYAYSKSFHSPDSPYPESSSYEEGFASSSTLLASIRSGSSGGRRLEDSMTLLDGLEAALNV